MLAEVTAGEPTAGYDLAAVGWFPISGPLPELAFEEDALALAAYAKGKFDGLPVDADFARGQESQKR